MSPMMALSDGCRVGCLDRKIQNPSLSSAEGKTSPEALGWGSLRVGAVARGQCRLQEAGMACLLRAGSWRNLKVTVRASGFGSNWRALSREWHDQIYILWWQRWLLHQDNTVLGLDISLEARDHGSRNREGGHSNSGCILKVEGRQPAGGLDVGGERKRTKTLSLFFSPSCSETPNWMFARSSWSICYLSSSIYLSFLCALDAFLVNSKVPSFKYWFWLWLTSAEILVTAEF